MPALDTMIDDLGVRLDPRGRAQKDPHAFKPGELLHFLNRAQNYLATELAIYYVRPLQIIVSAQSLDSNGAFDLTGLTVAVLEGERGIIAVKLTGGKYCSYKTDDERREIEDAGTTFYESKPAHWIIGNKVYARPFAGKTIDLEYKKQPVPMVFDKPLLYNFTHAASGGGSTTQFVAGAGQGLSAADSYYVDAVIYSWQFSRYFIVTAYTGTTRTFTVTPAASGNFGTNTFYFLTHGFDRSTNTECELTEAAQELMVDWSEGLGFDSSDDQRDLVKASNIFSKVNNRIYTMNSRFKPKRSRGLEVSMLDSY